MNSRSAMVSLLGALVVLLTATCTSGVSNVQQQVIGQRLRNGVVSVDAGAAKAQGASKDSTKDAGGEDDGDDDDDDDDDDAGDAKPDVVVVKNKIAVKARKEDEKQKERERLVTLHEAEILEWQIKVNVSAAEEDAINEQLADIAHPENITAEINKDVEVVAGETQSKAMANFVGDMWKEMNMFAAPFYKERLEENLPHTERQHEKAKEGLLQAQLDLATLKDIWRKQDAGEMGYDTTGRVPAVGTPKEESEEKQEDTPKRKRAKTEARTEARDDDDQNALYTPMFTKETMPGVSPTVHCVMLLAVQYFVIYTIWQILQTANSLSNDEYKEAQNIITATQGSVTYAPMMCVLFLGTRLYAIQLAKGHTEKYQLPPYWVQCCMYLATYTVNAQAIILYFHERQKLTGGAWKHVWKMLYNIGGVVIKVGVLLVCAGAFTMDGPDELWKGEAPTCPPAVQCTLLLTGAYFVVHFGLHLCRSVDKEHGHHGDGVVLRKSLERKLLPSFGNATKPVELAPMVCILFIGARMRALQIDPVNGNPQWWAQGCFYLVTWTIIFMVLLTFAIHLSDKNYELGDKHNDYITEISSAGLRTADQVVKVIGLAVILLGSSAVIVSVYLIVSPEGPEMTPPVSPAMQCVVFLTQLYFFIHTLDFIFQAFKSHISDHFMKAQANARRVSMFSPMLCMLFIGARMRALQLARSANDSIPPGAGPQGWVQEGMFLSAQCLMVGMVLSYLTAILFQSDMESPDFREKLHGRCGMAWGLVLGIFLNLFKYLMMIGMYGGVTLVIYGILIMTPDTLQPYAGYSGLVPGSKLFAPPTPPPLPHFF